MNNHTPWNAGDPSFHPLDLQPSPSSKYINPLTHPPLNEDFQPVIGSIHKATLTLVGTLKAWMLINVTYLAIALTMQTGSVIEQNSQERQVTSKITEMKKEQAWLVNQGLADDRRIGVLPDSVFGHSPWASSQGAYSSPNASIHGMDLTPSIKPIARHWADQRYAISVSTRNEDADYLRLENQATTYRHEEGHSRFYDKHLTINAPSNHPWPSDIERALLPHLNQQNEQKTTIISTQLPIFNDNTHEDGLWREVWLSSARGEAFADAFAVLSTARKAPGEMAHVALKLHAFRVEPNKITTVSSDITGSDHAVEMASFIAGQLDQDDVAKLSATGLDQLSGLIADDCMAWILARQAPSIGFFSDEGYHWWMHKAHREGLDLQKANMAWETWASESLSDFPQSVFGTFNYQVEGFTFHAQGLDQNLFHQDIHYNPDLTLRDMIHPTVHQSKPLWRYDGNGGLIVLKSNADTDMAENPDLIVVDSNGQISNPQNLSAKLLKNQSQIQSAYMGSATEQLLLAARLGIDPLQHAQWLENQETNNITTASDRKYFLKMIIRCAPYIEKHKKSYETQTRIKRGP